LSVHALAISLSLFLVSAAPCGEPTSVQASGLTRETLADGIYLLRATEALDFWTATNVVFIVDEHGVTVFDSFTRPETARLAIAEIRAITDKPVRTLINSHWHMDHWSGNAEFVKAFPGVDILATAQTRDFMKRMGAGFLTDGTAQALARERQELATAIATGKLPDGATLTSSVRQEREAKIKRRADFVAEMMTVPHVLPTTVFDHELTFWRGNREYRLLNMTGDASGSAVLFLPREKIVVTGDVLVSPPDGQGPPPWTTNSYAIAPWLASLHRLQALDAATIVPGQGPALRDKRYLALTARLYDAITRQVHAALERGVFRMDDVRKAVDVDGIGRQYPGGAVGPGTRFDQLVTSLTRKILQESLDGIVRQ
jgi:glyoxylase-like metal-dependent hydrolase (beta-lactamase superfamily II)